MKRSTIWIESTYRFITNEDYGEPEIVAVSGDITKKETLETGDKENIIFLDNHFLSCRLADNAQFFRAIKK
jgi:hypothetical protein